VPRTERTRRPFTVNVKSLRSAVRAMLFHLAGIVRNIVKEPEPSPWQAVREDARTRCVRICRFASAQLIAARIAPRYSWHSSELIGAQSEFAVGKARCHADSRR
jgi:hypothetical protein